MLTRPIIRSLIATALLITGFSGIFAFGLWQDGLARFSPDGVVTSQNWLLLRILLIALIVPGIALIDLPQILRHLSRLHRCLESLSQRSYLMYTIGAAAVLRVLAASVLPLRLNSDFAVYHELAGLWLLHGEYTDGSHPTAYFPPGWPYFLSRLYVAFGSNPQIGIVANIILSIAVVILTWILIRRTWGEMPARWAAVMLAVIPCELLFVNILGSETLFTALFLFAIVCLLIDHGDGFKSLLLQIVGGVFLGLASLTRSIAFFTPLALLPAYFVHTRGLARSGARWVTCVVGLLLVTVPWIQRNSNLLGRATLSTNTGVNLYIGNNPNAGVGFNEPSHDVLLLRSALDEARDDSVGFEVGTRYIVSHPVEFAVRGMLKGAFMLLNDTDGIATDLGGIAASGKINRYFWLALTTQATWMLFLLATVSGVGYLPRRLPGIDPLGMAMLGVICYWVAVHFVFFGAGRFHMPLVPFLAAFAGLALTTVSSEDDARSAK